MTLVVPDPFPVVRYHLRAVVEHEVELPDFAGSMLRGVFGHALRSAVCVTGMPECKACPLYRACDYPAIFETPPPAAATRIYQNIPVPYVVEPPVTGVSVLPRGSTLDFNIVLIGPALQRFATIARAWQDALQLPLGARQGRARLESIHTEAGELAFVGEGAHCFAHQHEHVIPGLPAHAHDACLRMLTPFCLRRHGRYLEPDDLRLRDVVSTIVRRVRELCVLQLRQPLDVAMPDLLAAVDALEVRRDLKHQGWRRYSSRQHRSMPMAGVIGNWYLRGNLVPFWPWLYLGQWLHAGKKASMGLGRYQLVLHHGGKGLE